MRIDIWLPTQLRRTDENLAIEADRMEGLRVLTGIVDKVYVGTHDKYDWYAANDGGWRDTLEGYAKSISIIGMSPVLFARWWATHTEQDYRDAFDVRYHWQGLWDLHEDDQECGYSETGIDLEPYGDKTPFKHWKRNGGEGMSQDEKNWCGYATNDAASSAPTADYILPGASSLLHYTNPFAGELARTHLDTNRTRRCKRLADLRWPDGPPVIGWGSIVSVEPEHHAKGILTPKEFWNLIEEMEEDRPHARYPNNPEFVHLYIPHKTDDGDHTLYRRTCEAIAESKP